MATSDASVEKPETVSSFPRPEHTRLPVKEKVLDRNDDHNQNFRPSSRMNCDITKGYGGSRLCYQDPTLPPFIAAGTVFRSGGKDVVFS